MHITEDSRSKCGCCHGQRCTCALKKEPHLDPVPETSVPPQPAALPSEQPRKPQLTSTKSESTLTIFRDGHHKPAHKHNDMAHKCGLPYTIPRSHTIHTGTDSARRSMDHLPLTQSSCMSELLANQSLQDKPRNVHGRPHHRRVKSEHGSPEIAPVAPSGDVPTSVPPLDLSSLFSNPQPIEEPTGGGVSAPLPMSMPKVSLEPLETSGLSYAINPFPTFPTTNASPVHGVQFQDPYNEPFFMSPDCDFPLSSAGLSTPAVDWSGIPLSSAMPTTSTQPPSYASFDYSSMGPGFTAPSSSGDISELEEFAPFPNLGGAVSDLHDFTSVSEGSDVDQYRISSASSFISLPQAQLLSSTQLESMTIDEFLQSANESTAALEQQMQVSMGMEPKSLAPQATYGIPDVQAFEKDMVSQDVSLPMTTTAAETMWPPTLFDPNSALLDENNFFPPSWVQ